MAGRFMRLVFRPGWRLHCVDPPIAWIRVDAPTVEARIQLTCYLSSRYAADVQVKELRLRFYTDSGEQLAPWIRSMDANDEPLGDTLDYEVSAKAPHHAFVDFAVDSPALLDEISQPGAPIPATVDALLNNAVEFRTIATLDLGRIGYLGTSSEWERVSTGRERGRDGE